MAREEKEDRHKYILALNMDNTKLTYLITN